jgi:hypothetical protein
MKLAVGAFIDGPVRSRATVLANPLNERIVRLDHDKGVSARDGHCHGSLLLSRDRREYGLSREDVVDDLSRMEVPERR